MEYGVGDIVLAIFATFILLPFAIYATIISWRDKILTGLDMLITNVILSICSLGMGLLLVLFWTLVFTGGSQ